VSGNPPELHLALRGDWGIANLYTICGWLAAGLRLRSAPDSTFVVHTGRGGVDNIDALLEGEVDVALTTPIVTADMARRGRGLYATAHPELMAIAAFPHRDRLALCIGVEPADRWNLKSFSDLALQKPALRIAVPPNEDDHAMSYAIHRVLEAHGCSWSDFATWGGELVEYEWPMPAVADVAAGSLDGIFYEAIMLWHQFLDRRPMRFLAMEPARLDELARDYGYTPATLEPGEHEGVTEPTLTLDFSQFLLMARQDLDDEIVRLITETVVEDRAMLESKYRHLSLNRTPMLYPLEPEALCRTDPVPLHPSAEAQYRKIGALA
jgi:TRAP-type uncharacterized transport system substrate-binding protein